MSTSIKNQMRQNQITSNSKAPFDLARATRINDSVDVIRRRLQTDSYNLAMREKYPLWPSKSIVCFNW